jgi:hypothetical protein
VQEEDVRQECGGQEQGEWRVNINKQAHVITLAFPTNSLIALQIFYGVCWLIEIRSKYIHGVPLPI